MSPGQIKYSVASNGVKGVCQPFFLQVWNWSRRRGSKFSPTLRKVHVPLGGHLIAIWGEGAKDESRPC